MPRYIFKHTYISYVGPSMKVLDPDVRRVLLVIAVDPAAGASVVFGEPPGYDFLSPLRSDISMREFRRVEMGPIICERVDIFGIVPTDVFLTEGLCLDVIPGRLGC